MYPSPNSTAPRNYNFERDRSNDIDGRSRPLIRPLTLPRRLSPVRPLLLPRRTVLSPSSDHWQNETSISPHELDSHITAPPPSHPGQTVFRSIEEKVCLILQESLNRFATSMATVYNLCASISGTTVHSRRSGEVPPDTLFTRTCLLTFPSQFFMRIWK